MSENPAINLFLISAALSSFAAAALHFAIIFGGPSWLRFFGAGEQYARAAEAGEVWPYLVTMAIGAILAIWGLYALKASGMAQDLPLPFLRLGLLAITGVYLLRGLVLIPALLPNVQPHGPFMIWSSVICLGIGLAHAIGLVTQWSFLR
ncbi:MAG: hypothetical protein COA47_14140 [Robiginitomaculum sp.]|nr:MAG: hypothetical protein COA47_14140 [Robiginitomaculum sp.]